MPAPAFPRRAGAPAPARKYKNRVTYVAGKRFDSAKESRRYTELLVLQAGGLISELETQVTIRCEVAGHLICKYVADFRYRDLEHGGASVVEDVKSDATRKLPVYRLKKKLVLALFGVTISEV